MKRYNLYDDDYCYLTRNFASLDEACAFAVQEVLEHEYYYNKGEHVVILVKAEDGSESREVSVDLPA